MPHAEVRPGSGSGGGGLLLLRFGYRLSYPGLLEKRPEAKEITELTEDMQDNMLDKMKKGLGL